MKTYFLILLLFLAGCAAGTRYTLHEDNDIFKPTKNNDSDFSQGVRVTGEHPDSSGSTSYFAGQNFYTPGNKQIKELQPNDRPYAGYLYAGADFKFRRAPAMQDTFGVTAGIVGPHSYAEQTQNTVHRWIGDNTAKGWDNQLEDEIGIILKAERAVAFPLQRNFDLVTTLGGNLGNVYTQAYTGALLRFGYNLPDYFFGGDIIFPRAPNPVTAPGWSLYMFAGPFGRAVLQNIFLDGNTFRDSHSIDKKPFVAEGRAGFAIEKGYYRIMYTYVVQSKEYDTQQKTPNDFGEITLSWGWD